MIEHWSSSSGGDPPGVYAHGTQAERVVVVCALVLMYLLVLLTAVDRDAWPLPVAAVMVSSGVLWCLRSRVRRRGRRDRLLAGEAARGVAQLERWLATGLRA